MLTNLTPQHIWDPQRFFLQGQAPLGGTPRQTHSRRSSLKLARTHTD